jgi:hypothetical protein
MMEKLTSIICRILFILAFVLTGIGVLEWLARHFGSTISGGLYDPGRLLEFSAMGLVFVIALQLREIKNQLRGKASD